MTTARDAHTCFMCERALNAAEEVTFVQMTTDKAQNLPASIRDREDSLRAAREEAAALQRALPAWEECQRLHNEEVPRAEESLKVCVERLLLPVACLAGALLTLEPPPIYAAASRQTWQLRARSLQRWRVELPCTRNA